MREAIGGYFEIEGKGIGQFPHKDGILLNTGRNALEFILRQIPDITNILLPYFTCKVVLEPIKKLNIPFSFYHINKDLEIDEEIKLCEGEYIIVNNYFGIKDAYIQQLFDYFGEHLIVDNAQSFFAPIISGMKSFYSCRKFFGVPDGGIAYGVSGGALFEFDDSIDHCSHLFIRKELCAEAGFESFKRNECKLNNQDIKYMSELTKGILNRIDYNEVKLKRRRNFEFLHSILSERNSFTIPDSRTFQCPMIYPFKDSKGINYRKKLIQNRVYIAKYWPHLAANESFNFESQLADEIIPLPIDQRYNLSDMQIIAQIVI